MIALLFVLLFVGVVGTVLFLVSGDGDNKEGNAIYYNILNDGSPAYPITYPDCAVSVRANEILRKTVPYIDPKASKEEFEARCNAVRQWAKNQWRAAIQISDREVKNSMLYRIQYYHDGYIDEIIETRNREDSWKAVQATMGT